MNESCRIRYPVRARGNRTRWTQQPTRLPARTAAGQKCQRWQAVSLRQEHDRQEEDKDAARLTTINYWADDVKAAWDWYAQVLEAEPYFVRPEEGPPAYVEFRVGPDEDELGLIDRRYAPPSTSRDPGGAIMHWHVDDVSAAVARLLELGATEYQPVTEREAGFVTASVVDPFGNILGLMYSPHFLEMHADPV